VPACLAAVAYVDPGNFGVNIAAGAGHGYALLFVVVLASAAASLIQFLAAKLGSTTGLSLSEACAGSYGRGVRTVLWIQAELAVVMTELAEVVGGALALQLLLGVPLVLGAVVISALSMLILAAHGTGRSVYPVIVLGLLGVIVLALAVLVGVVGVDGPALGRGLVPHGLAGDGTTLAVGIIGATVMPHALHFHSAMARPVGVIAVAGRRARARELLARHGPRRLSAGTGRSVAVAMTIAGLANAAIIMVAAALPGKGRDGVSGAYAALGGGGVLLAVALLASGLAASLVGVHTGQLVMEGFAPGWMSWWGRRLLTAVPPLILLALGMDAVTALVLSQVALSFALPGTLVPLVWLTSRRHLMGRAVNRLGTTLLAAGVTGVIVGLDVSLLVGLVI